MDNKKEFSLEYIFKFIFSFLSVYEKINIKDENKLLCLEKDYDTLDFNEVSYLILNEIEIPENISKEIMSLEQKIRELYIRDEIRYIEEKDKKIITLIYDKNYYDIILDDKGFTYTKSKYKSLEYFHVCGLDFFIDQKIKKLER